ncbi:alkyl sulfatase C-terminal domain-containing protein [Geodermatophilus sp. SYSU D00700]
MASRSSPRRAAWSPRCRRTSTPAAPCRGAAPVRPVRRAPAWASPGPPARRGCSHPPWTSPAPALIQPTDPRSAADADLEVTLTRAQLLGVLAGHGLEGTKHVGDPAAWTRLQDCLTAPDRAFPVVTP